ncbi:MAG TPA: HAMP domain-containing sensor histidine kinase [Candidatus Polarisedimenticolaceae bacterium]|nr:HAMP domain-containing sensor histidine kinase [Candidatus Polarisedimenticolaceae bacterium]
MTRDLRAWVGKRRVLWIGFFAVLVPLAVLLAMQYGWLTRLEKTSAIAEKAWLNNYLEAVSSKVEYFYRKQAERALNVPESLLAYQKPEKIGRFFEKKQVEGAKYLFVYYDPPDSDGDPFMAFYDPVNGSVEQPADHRMLRAITVALSPWTMLLSKSESLSSHALSVDEKDPENRIILNPLSDDSCTIIGIAGMIVDNGHFEQRVLPGAIEQALPKFFDRRAADNLALSVLDGRGDLVLGLDGGARQMQGVARSIPFIYSDWKLVLGSRHTTPEQWAKSNFVLNVSLSVLLAIVLLGGIAMALRTASRQIYLSQMKSDFVSNVSHELRTPLASIRVFGEFLRLGRVADPAKTREYGEFIETESRRLTQLINNILDFSKIESGAKTYRFERVDLAEVLSDTVRSLEVSLRHKGFRLGFDTPVDPVPVEIDPDAIAQAVANLVDNAVKYSNGAREVDVRLERDEREVVISIRDFGIGISGDEQDKIFERFHRVSTGLVHDVKGSGLGLSIVSHIVKAHSGEVRVESEPGRGSIFSIHLPAEHLPETRPTGLTAARADSG